MSLREEIAQDIRYAFSEHSRVQAAFIERGEGWIDLTGASSDERAALFLTRFTSLRDAIFRLADEIDALR